jgi:hypothetical protein
MLLVFAHATIVLIAIAVYSVRHVERDPPVSDNESDDSNDDNSDDEDSDSDASNSSDVVAAASPPPAVPKGLIGVVWEWLGDTVGNPGGQDKWIAYPPQQAAKFEAAFSASKPKVKVDVQRFIDLKLMVQARSVYFRRRFFWFRRRLFGLV